MYPTLEFILIGDAGEIDIDIYTSIARKYPERVKSIYIRAVDKSSKNDRITEFKHQNPDLDIVLIENKADALEHAKANSYI